MPGRLTNAGTSAWASIPTSRWFGRGATITIQPVWNGRDFAPKLLLPLSLSYDHRVIDGALAARFTTYLSQVLADMRRVLL